MEKIADGPFAKDGAVDEEWMEWIATEELPRFPPSSISNGNLPDRVYRLRTASTDGDGQARYLSVAEQPVSLPVLENGVGSRELKILCREQRQEACKDGGKVVLSRNGINRGGIDGLRFLWRFVSADGNKQVCGKFLFELPAPPAPSFLH